ncbi:hypothetical protein BDV39DRAFT_193982 [Aspergillus sergii]|uniref:Peptidyl-arginine deiminase domain protein n=1 Tax=Aspergillus sergii TaxID=1034303 RepID=A0A5N6WZI1_9EURO|nr:hypothetical protein BDV39DRAFT_193982 [Aspergillus sergii]
MTIRAKFYMPHEGHHYCHGKIIMAWPGPNNPNYKKCQIARIKNEQIAIAKAICHFQNVILLVHSTEVPEAERAFQDCGRYGVEIQATDVTPTFVVSEGSSRSIPHGIDFNFNGWGGRYPSNNNTLLAKQFLAQRQIPRVKTSIVLEGGALETDGEGTLLATQSSILNPTRNPGVSRVAIEKERRRLLSVSKIIWLPGLKGYEVTDTHIDIWARSVAPGKVEAHLEGPVLSDADLCLSYVNYVLINCAAIAPQFGDEKADSMAKQTPRTLFPNREVVQVCLEEIVLNGGGIHCVTQQIPIP